MRISKRSAAQRNDRARLVEELGCFLCRYSDVVRDGGTYYLVINNLGERCLCA